MAAERSARQHARRLPPPHLRHHDRKPQASTRTAVGVLRPRGASCSAPPQARQAHEADRPRPPPSQEAHCRGPRRGADGRPLGAREPSGLDRPAAEAPGPTPVPVLTAWRSRRGSFTAGRPPRTPPPLSLSCSVVRSSGAGPVLTDAGALRQEVPPPSRRRYVIRYGCIADSCRARARAGTRGAWRSERCYCNSHAG